MKKYCEYKFGIQTPFKKYLFALSCLTQEYQLEMLLLASSASKFDFFISSCLLSIEIFHNFWKKTIYLQT